ncbi:MAG: host-nuclease inhibitor Gam family protein [Azoarcus sp.]|nr:host-nuclease inhibitor Gam family protein [Azoarcus sp.]
MVKKSRIKSAAQAAPVPQSQEHANAHIYEIGAKQRDLARIEAAMNDELAAIKDRYEREAQPIRARIDALHAGVQVWGEANRTALTNEGRIKTVRVPAGEFGWRTDPPSMRVMGSESVVNWLRAHGLDRFVRTSYEPNREALLNEPNVAGTVPGVTIRQGEKFFIAPFEAELDGVAK